MTKRQERVTPVVMVEVVPVTLSTIKRMIFSTMSTRSQMSNFLPAGVSDLKMISKICFLVSERYLVGISHWKSILCMMRPIQSMRRLARPSQSTAERRCQMRWARFSMLSISLMIYFFGSERE